jgi:hypothetical protein
MIAIRLARFITGHLYCILLQDISHRVNFTQLMRDELWNKEMLNNVYIRYSGFRGSSRGTDPWCPCLPLGNGTVQVESRLWGDRELIWGRREATLRFSVESPLLERTVKRWYNECFSPLTGRLSFPDNTAIRCKVSDTIGVPLPLIGSLSI